MKWIILFLLLLPMVIADMELIEVDFEVDVRGGRVNLEAENNNYNYGCDENTTYTPSITIQRDIEREECQNDINNLTAICSDLIEEMKKESKDKDAYYKLYLNCSNEKQFLTGNKEEYDKCQDDLDTCKSEKESVTNENNNNANLYNTCNTGLTTCNNQKEICEQDLDGKGTTTVLVGIGGLLLGGGLVYSRWGKKLPKGSKEEQFPDR